MKWWVPVVVITAALLISGAVEIRVELAKVCAIAPIRC